MFCKYCGASNADEANFCRSCGRILKQQPQFDDVNSGKQLDSFEQEYEQADVDEGFDSVDFVPEPQFDNMTYADGDFPQEPQFGNDSYAGDFSQEAPLANEAYFEEDYPQEEFQPEQPKKNTALIVIIVVLSVILVAAIGVLSFTIAKKHFGLFDNHKIEFSESETIESENSNDENVESEDETTAESTTETTTESTTEPTTESTTVDGKLAQFTVDYATAPDKIVSKGNYIVTPKAGLFLRSGPGTGFEKLLGKSMEQGTNLTYIGESNNVSGWAYVYVPQYAKYGWVSKEYITAEVNYTTTTTSTKSSVVNPDKGGNSSKVQVQPSEGLVLRKGPGTNYDKIVTLAQGTELVVSGYSDTASGWIYVYVSSRGIYGWVSSKYVG